MSVASSQNGRTQKQRECETPNQTQKGCAVHIVHIVQWVKMCALRSGVRTQALFLSWWRKLNSCVLSSTVRTSPRRLSHTLRENGGTEETSGAESEGESERFLPSNLLLEGGGERLVRDQVDLLPHQRQGGDSATHSGSSWGRLPGHKDQKGRLLEGDIYIISYHLSYMTYMSYVICLIWMIFLLLSWTPLNFWFSGEVDSSLWLPAHTRV